MLLKPGVDISRLKPPIRKRLNELDTFYKSYGLEMIITSTYEGTHSPGSLHYADLAIDTNRPPGEHSLSILDLKVTLGDDYDVVLEADHLHLEYDPKQS